MSDLASHRRAVTFATRAAKAYRERTKDAEDRTDKATLDFAAALAACNDAGLSYRAIERATGFSLRHIHRLAQTAKEAGLQQPTI